MKKIIAILIALVMVLSLIPQVAFAADDVYMCAEQFQVNVSLAKPDGGFVFTEDGKINVNLSAVLNLIGLEIKCSSAEVYYSDREDGEFKLLTTLDAKPYYRDTAEGKDGQRQVDAYISAYEFPAKCVAVDQEFSSKPIFLKAVLVNGTTKTEAKGIQEANLNVPPTYISGGAVSSSKVTLHVVTNKSYLCPNVKPDGYYIYKYDSSSKKYKKVKTISKVKSDGSASYTATKLKKDTTYKYKAIPLYKKPDGTLAAVGESEVLTTKTTEQNKYSKSYSEEYMKEHASTMYNVDYYITKAYYSKKQLKLTIKIYNNSDTKLEGIEDFAIRVEMPGTEEYVTNKSFNLDKLAIEPGSYVTKTFTFDKDENNKIFNLRSGVVTYFYGYNRME